MQSDFDAQVRQKVIRDDGTFEIGEMMRIVLRVFFVQVFHHRQLQSGYRPVSRGQTSKTASPRNSRR